MLDKLLIFFLFLGPLIFFHELGHFLFARFFGVKVEVFSIGFGPKLFRKKGKETEYAFSLIPLGGYVKMFGDDPLTSDELTDEEKKVAFTHKSKWARFWIVFGGPLANFILAFVLYFSLGITGEKAPEVKFGNVAVNSEYYNLGVRSGDIVKAVNGKEIVSYDDFNFIDSKLNSMTLLRGDEVKKVSFTKTQEEFVKDFVNYRSALRAPVLVDKNQNYFVVSNSEKINPSLSFEEIFQNPSDEIFLIKTSKESIEKFPEIESVKNQYDIKSIKGKSLGDIMIERRLYVPDLMVKNVVMDSPADKAQLTQGDILLTLNDKRLKSFEDLRKSLQAFEGDKVKLEYLRDGKVESVSLAPEVKENNGKQVKSIGVWSSVIFLPSKLNQTPGKGFFESLSLATYRTYDGFVKTLEGFKKLILAEVSLDSLGGPLTIGKVASDSFYVSLSMFFKLMAIISINLGIINLFPIPVLDGGHIVFLGFELINGGPLSRKKLQIAQSFGMSLLFILIFVALFNDIARLL